MYHLGKHAEKKGTFKLKARDFQTAKDREPDRPVPLTGCVTLGRPLQLC